MVAKGFLDSTGRIMALIPRFAGFAKPKTSSNMVFRRSRRRSLGEPRVASTKSKTTTGNTTTSKIAYCWQSLTTLFFGAA